jgi:hypothetical protein
MGIATQIDGSIIAVGIAEISDFDFGVARYLVP